MSLEGKDIVEVGPFDERVDAVESIKTKSPLKIKGVDNLGDDVGHQLMVKRAMRRVNIENDDRIVLLADLNSKNLNRQRR